MKVIFDDYEYVDLEDNDKGEYYGDEKPNTAYNDKYFQSLMTDGRFDEAIKYASKYRFTNTEKQQAYANTIENLKQKTKKTSSFYGSIGNEDHLNQIKFIDGVFLPGAFEGQKNNPYVQKLQNIKDNLFLQFDGAFGEGKNVDYSTIAIDFSPKKQVGLFGWDWIAKDNIEDNIDAFYERSGLNEAQLRSAGIRIENKDGHTILKFDKDNDLANQILYYAPTASNFTTYSAYDRNGNNVMQNKGLTSSSAYTSESIKEFKKLIDDTQETKRSYFNNLGAIDGRAYSSTVGPLLTDNLSTLNDALNSGSITPNFILR